MKAMVYAKYGPPEVLSLKEVEKPSPQANEVLVKVVASSINAADWHLLTADIFLVRLFTGLFKPKKQVLGADLAGRVEAVGHGVAKFKPGDAVFGKVEVQRLGAYAEYMIAGEEDLVLKPNQVSFETAAAVPLAAVTALQGLRDLGQIQAGHKVLINGASGGVGTFAVQLAKHFGAEVTAVCSTSKVQQAKELGADHVMDYTQQDFTQLEQKYDLILAVNGYHPIAAYQRVLSPQGAYVMVGGHQKQMFAAILKGPWLSKKGGQRLGFLTLKPNPNDLPLLKSLLETGKLKPVVDKRFPLSELVEAFRYFGQGHARGKVVISVAQE
ncbi:MAG: NAD(P)-dependent alcohol dehydrogenase [Deltaproteobacteria bacterium]|nr:NAD(P)-dependent alcohol dehydrogenase [Deltaproteobacteria bacterium]